MLRLDRMFRIFDQEPEALAAAATAPVIPAKE
jgi:hypothetical protein